jgi:hypothetical protein
MWRCHCGETNLNRDTHCRDCSGARSTHEDRDFEPRPRAREKNVYIGFFGMGMGDERATAPARRVLTERELDSHYRRSHRTHRIQWVLYAVAGLAVLGMLVWQVLRRP